MVLSIKRCIYLPEKQVGETGSAVIEMHLDKNVLVLWYLPYATASVIFLAIIAVLVRLDIFSSPFSDPGDSIVIFLLLLIIAINVLIAIYLKLYHSLFTYSIDEFHGIVIRSGIINRKRIAIPYEKVQNINTSRNILETVLGICTLIVETVAGKDIGEGVIPGISINEREKIISLITSAVENQRQNGGRGNGLQIPHSVQVQPEDDSAFRSYRFAVEADLSSLKSKISGLEAKVAHLEGELERKSKADSFSKLHMEEVGTAAKAESELDSDLEIPFQSLSKGGTKPIGSEHLSLREQYKELQKNIIQESAIVTNSKNAYGVPLKDAPEVPGTGSESVGKTAFKTKRPKA